MKSTTVGSSQRFSRSNPCPVCGGADRDPRGHGVRCFGFLSNDGQYAHCSREEKAGGLPVEEQAQTYAHKLHGDCRCGQTHGVGQVAPVANAPATRRRIVATYAYTDEQDLPLFEVVRYDPKDFRQRRSDGNGGVIWNLDGARRVPYRLREVLDVAAAGWRVYFCEGEKDVDALKALGLSATTNPGGQGKWHDEYREHFRGAEVVVVVDKDRLGREHGQVVARSLHGTAKSVKVIEMPGDQVKDASDYLSAGGTKADIERLADGAPEWIPPIDRTRAMSGADFLSLDIPPPKWLVTGHLLEQSIGYIVGLPKVFKSFYALELGFAVAMGAPFLDRFDAGEPLRQRRVLMVQFESSLAAFQGRYRAAANRHGNPRELYVMSNVPLLLEDQASRESIEAELERVRPELLILDPLAAITTGDENDATAMGVVVRTLRGWRDTYGCAILTVHHANKSKQEGNGRAGLKMRGSTALYASSEATISIERPNDDELTIHVRSEVKDGEGPRPYVCDFDPGTSTLQLTASAIYHAVTDDEIVAAVGNAKAVGIDQGTLAAALGISDKTIQRRVQPLLGKGLWVKPRTGVGRTPISYIAQPSGGPS